MFKLFNRKLKPLGQALSDSIYWLGSKDLMFKIVNQYREFALKNSELLLDFGSNSINSSQFNRLIDDELKQENPHLFFYSDNLNFFISIIYTKPNPYTWYNEGVMLTFEHSPNFIQIEDVLKLNDLPFISRFIDNASFKSRQNEHQIEMLEHNGADIRNKLLFPELVPSHNYYKYECNPGKTSKEIKDFGPMSVSFENYYSPYLLEALGEETVKSALNTMKIPYEYKDQYFYFKLFNNHLKSESKENIQKIIQYKSLIKFDDFIQSHSPSNED